MMITGRGGVRVGSPIGPKHGGTRALINRGFRPINASHPFLNGRGTEEP